jgi:hypothetical protein
MRIILNRQKMQFQSEWQFLIILKKIDISEYMPRHHLLLALLLFLSLIHAQDILREPDHQLIYEQNLLIVQNQSKTSFIPDGTPKYPSTLENPINHAFFSFGPAHPSVSEHISTNSPPSFFWIWGESHPQKYSKYIPPPVSSACPGPTYHLFSQGPPILDGILSYSLEDFRATQPLNSSEPLIHLDIDEETWNSLKTKDSFPTLVLNFDGKVSVPYRQLKIYYLAVTVCNGKVCNTICVRYEQNKDLVFSRPVLDSKTFIVEHSRPMIFLLQPIDHEQLNIRPKVDAVYFTNTYAHRLELLIQDSLLSSTALTKYKKTTDEFGFLRLERIKFNHSDMANISTLAKITNRAYSNTTQKILRPTSLDFVDENYLMQYFTHTQTNLPLGESKTTLRFIDDYQNEFNYSFNLSTRLATGISSNNTLLFHNQNMDEIQPISQGPTTLYSGDRKTRSSQKIQHANYILFSAPFMIFGGIILLMKLRRI